MLCVCTPELGGEGCVESGNSNSTVLKVEEDPPLVCQWTGYTQGVQDDLADLLPRASLRGQRMDNKLGAFSSFHSSTSRSNMFFPYVFR